MIYFENPLYLTLLSIWTYVASFFAVLLNSLLIYVTWKVKSKYLGEYIIFFYIFGIIGIFYGLSFGNLSLFTFVADGNLVYASFGWPAYYFPSTILLHFWGQTLVATFLMTTFSFIHRYIQLCHPKFFLHLLGSHWFKWIFSLIFWFNIAYWSTVIYMFASVNHKKADYLVDIVMQNYNINVSGRAMLGGSMELQSHDSMFVFVIANMFILNVFLISAVIFCTIQIYRYLRSSSVSQKTKNLSAKMFRLLLLQSISPVVFCYCPLMISVGTMTAHIRVSIPFNILICILYSGFGVLNPLIIIYFVADFQRFVSREIFRRKRAMSVSSTPSQFSNVRTPRIS